jgi:hypothetical protein
MTLFVKVALFHLIGFNFAAEQTTHEFKIALQVLRVGQILKAQGR